MNLLSDTKVRSHVHFSKLEYNVYLKVIFKSTLIQNIHYSNTTELSKYLEVRLIKYGCVFQRETFLSLSLLELSVYVDD